MSSLVPIVSNFMNIADALVEGNAPGVAPGVQGVEVEIQDLAGLNSIASYAPPRSLDTLNEVPCGLRPKSSSDHPRPTARSPVEFGFDRKTGLGRQYVCQLF